MSTEHPSHPAKSPPPAGHYADPYLSELSRVLRLFKHAWRVECGMKIEAMTNDTNATASEMRNVGQKWLECEAEMNRLCDQLVGESQIYLAVDVMYRLLPRYRLTLGCLHYAAGRLHSMASEMADQPQLQSLINMASHSAHDYHEHLSAMDDTRFPPMRSGHLVRH